MLLMLLLLLLQISNDDDRKIYNIKTALTNQTTGTTTLPQLWQRDTTFHFLKYSRVMMQYYKMIHASFFIQRYIVNVVLHCLQALHP